MKHIYNYATATDYAADKRNLPYIAYVRETNKPYAEAYVNDVQALIAHNANILNDDGSFKQTTFSTFWNKEVSEAMTMAQVQAIAGIIGHYQYNYVRYNGEYIENPWQPFTTAEDFTAEELGGKTFYQGMFKFGYMGSEDFQLKVCVAVDPNTGTPSVVAVGNEDFIAEVNVTLTA